MTDEAIEVLLVCLLIAGAFSPSVALVALVLTIGLYAAFGGDDGPPAAGVA